MLRHLRIRNLAVVEDLTLELGPGLQILTGETGAGKSVIVDALSLVLGGRGDAGLVRAGADEAVVEALFDLVGAPDEPRRAVAEVLDEPADELIVRRTLRSEGRSRILLNGNLVTAAQVQRATGPLVDVCSQHEHHALADSTAHLGFLDAFAALDEARAEMASRHRVWREADTRSIALAHQWKDREVQLGRLRFEREELAAVAPLPEEDVILEAERARLVHAVRLVEAATLAEGLIGSADPHATDLLSRARHALAGVVGLDPSLEPSLAAVDVAVTALEEVRRDLGRYARGLSADPARLASLEDRLAALKRLARRYGGSLEGALQRRKSVEEELQGLEDLDERLDEAEGARQRAAEAALEAARRLSTMRRQAGRALGEAITNELQALGMGDARVEVDVAPLERRAGELEWDGCRMTPTGLDRVELLVAPNRGEPPRPLRRIASGGELSRALLAIKRVLASRGPRALHVFDEVDTGVGGAVADAIGRKLHEVSRGGQVLCITHLAPIAAYGDRHLHVTKRSDGLRTYTEVRELSGEERVEEIARMMGGHEIEEATRAAARALLAQAERLRSGDATLSRRSP